MAHSITLGGIQYCLPNNLDVDAYMHYLEVRDDIMDREGKTGLYTAKQFRAMMDCIVELYDNQFTIEELKDRETGLSVGEIVLEFVAIEVGVGQEVNSKGEDFSKNFMSQA